MSNDPHTEPSADLAPSTAFLATACPSGGQHEWRLTEDGYTRWWHTTITGTTIRASFQGSGDWSDDGDGEHLECLRCFTRTPVPADFTVDYV